MAISYYEYTRHMNSYMSIMSGTVYKPAVMIYDAGEVVQSDAEFPGPVH